MYETTLSFFIRAKLAPRCAVPGALNRRRGWALRLQVITVVYPEITPEKVIPFMPSVTPRTVRSLLQLVHAAVDFIMTDRISRDNGPSRLFYIDLCFLRLPPCSHSVTDW